MTNERLKAFLPEEQRAAPIISAVKSVSKQVGRSMAQVALAWLRHQMAPVIPIIGARKVSQLQDNLASLDLEFSVEQLKYLDEASRIEFGFPQGLYQKEIVHALRYGGMWDLLSSGPTIAHADKAHSLADGRKNEAQASAAGDVRWS